MSNLQIKQLIILIFCNDSNFNREKKSNCPTLRLALFLPHWDQLVLCLVSSAPATAGQAVEAGFGAQGVQPPHPHAVEPGTQAADPS